MPWRLVWGDKVSFQPLDHANCPPPQMFCDLRMFDKAKEVIPSGDSAGAKYLMKRQTEWCESAKDPTVRISF